MGGRQDHLRRTTQRGLNAGMEFNLARTRLFPQAHLPDDAPARASAPTGASTPHASFDLPEPPAVTSPPTGDSLPARRARPESRRWPVLLAAGVAALAMVLAGALITVIASR
jgi:hypothetical protein